MQECFEQVRLSLQQPYELSTLKCDTRSIHVVRDDLLQGGTKERGIVPFLQNLIREGHTTFLYSSPFCGFAQVALAYACKGLGVHCIIIAEKDQRYPGMEMHPFTRLARDAGAEILLKRDLFQAEDLAIRLERSTGAYKIPLGFDHPHFQFHLANAVVSILEDISHQMTIKRIWLPLGSGTLARTFLKILSPEVQLRLVNVRVLKPDDQRIMDFDRFSQVQIHHAPMVFSQTAQSIPEIPSNSHYDAKVWDFISRYGEDGDLWWNVAR